MLKIILACSPIPYVLNGKMVDGLIYSWPQKCKTCTRLNCTSSTNALINICPMGFNYIKADCNVIFSGIIVREFTDNSKARSKAIKQYRKNIISKHILNKLITRIDGISDEEKSEINSQIKKKVDDYIFSDNFSADLFSEIKDDINKAFSSLHDYKQFLSQILQNINILVESRYTGKTFEDKLNSASHQERAIYYATKIMDEKITTSLYLKYPERIKDESGITKFSPHGLALKYIRIYQMAFENKHIDVRVQGESYGDIEANPKAVGVIIHTLIDNALKYSPKDEQVRFFFHEDEASIEFSVESKGPRVLPEEKSLIFKPYKRGINAIAHTEEGTGFGLYISQQIARSIGTQISFEQEYSTQSTFLNTTFSIVFPKAYM